MHVRDHALVLRRPGLCGLGVAAVMCVCSGQSVLTGKTPLDSFSAPPFRSVLALFPQFGPFRWRPGIELQRALWERETPAKMAAALPARSDARGRRRPSLAGCGREQRTARALKSEFWRAVCQFGFFFFNPRTDPASRELLCRAAERRRPVPCKGPRLPLSAHLSSPRSSFYTCKVLG